MSEPTEITSLRCEYLVNPLGIDETAPRLSWQLSTARRGARQTAYRLTVASSADALANGQFDRWDSGRVLGDQTTHIVYEGTALRSRDASYWQVEVWDETDTSVVSAPAFWTMGLLEKSDWSARWISADPTTLANDPDAITPTLTEPGTPGVFRKTFNVDRAITRATLYTSARGLVHLIANDQRVTADLFAPEWTDYDKRIHYRTYDVTALLRPGDNALSITLGDGWWSGYVGWQETRARYGSLENSFLAQLELEFADGTRETIITDSSWSSSTGPILSSDFMMGEVYDARRKGGPDLRAGHSHANDTTQAALPHAVLAHLPAREVVAPSARLVAQRAEPVRITQTIRPVSANQIRPGVWIYDLGQNITGWVRLKLQAPAGTRFILRHGERLSPDGTLYTENLRRARATDTYIAAGTPTGETYEPHFTFHGFQYVELSTVSSQSVCHIIDDKRSNDKNASCHIIDDKTSGVEGGSRQSIDATFRPLPDAILACVIHSATPPAGHFECSNDDVNRLWLNGLWSQKDNFLTVPTDCPQRDERLGWMGDAQVFLRTATYNMDVAAFFTKWMIDVEDAQTPDGIFPDTAPRLREDERFVGLDQLGGGAGWADAGIIIPYTLWQVYGDQRILERHWDAMVKWLDWIERHNPDGLRLNELGNNYGDWLCIPTDTSFRTQSPMKNFLATAYWADDANKLARIATTLGKPAEAMRFRAMFEKVRAAFQREWLRPQGQLAVENQTAYLLALAFDLLPTAVRPLATARLVDDIRSLDWHLSTGFIGISHLNPQLTLNGRSDVAYTLLLRDDYPSWLYPVKHGATTIWERWNGWTEADGFFNPHMNSFNHYSLGSVGEWLFRHVAGIELDPAHPGFQHFILRPFLGSSLAFARATYRTLHGEIISSWQRHDTDFTWTVQVPANCSADIFIPCAASQSLESAGLSVQSHDGHFAHCAAGAGTYVFKSTVHV